MLGLHGSGLQSLGSSSYPSINRAREKIGPSSVSWLAGETSRAPASFWRARLASTRLPLPVQTSDLPADAIGQCSAMLGDRTGSVFFFTAEFHFMRNSSLVRLGHRPDANPLRVRPFRFGSSNFPALLPISDDSFFMSEFKCLLFFRCRQQLGPIAGQILANKLTSK
ncbi:hypothetical protein BRADI_2g01469v3 [Brachypodium distachyon]|uniref:Uncharacterized protein n=1 Tax=Brachypodium distachyon TaxID=15368 RepID=A0A2K2D6E4_BRADI|nr:hypothetical protein BRADI_2g01469v3 [Brachypodium distachyon]